MINKMIKRNFVTRIYYKPFYFNKLNIDEKNKEYERLLKKYIEIKRDNKNYCEIIERYIYKKKYKVKFDKD